MRKILFLSFVFSMHLSSGAYANVFYDLVVIEPFNKSADQLKTYSDDFLINWTFSDHFKSQQLKGSEEKTIEYTITLLNLYDNVLKEYTTQDTFQIIQYKHLPTDGKRILLKLRGIVKDKKGRTIQTLQSRVLSINIRPAQILSIDQLLHNDTVSQKPILMELLRNDFFINALYRYHVFKNELGSEYQSFFSTYMMAIINHNEYNLDLTGEYPKISVGKVRIWGDAER